MNNRQGRRPVLTKRQIINVRQAYRTGKTLEQLAKQYRISITPIWKAVNGIEPYNCS